MNKQKGNEWYAFNCVSRINFPGKIVYFYFLRTAELYTGKVLQVFMVKNRI